MNVLVVYQSVCLEGLYRLMQRDISQASVAIHYFSCEVPSVEVEKLKTYKLVLL